MGSISIPMPISGRRFLIEEETSATHRVLKCRMIGNTAYMAVRITIVGEEPIVTGVVYLTSRKEGRLTFKAMDESALPYYYKCPTTVLEMLTDVDDLPLTDIGKNNARKWREECWKYAVDTELFKQKRKPGTWLKAKEPEGADAGGYGRVPYGQVVKIGRMRVLSTPTFSFKATRDFLDQFEIVDGDEIVQERRKML